MAYFFIASNIRRIFATFFLLYLSLAVGWAEPSSDQEEVHVTMKKLNDCPLWTAVGSDDSDGRRAIVECYLEISHRLEIDEMRRMAIAYMRSFKAGSDAEFDASAKLFALWRVYFDVPNRVDTLRVTAFGNWGNPITPEHVDLLWPMSFDDEGHFKLVGVFQQYFGPPYDPLEEFAELSKAFGRRSLPD